MDSLRTFPFAMLPAPTLPGLAILAALAASACSGGVQRATVSTVDGTGGGTTTGTGGAGGGDTIPAHCLAVLPAPADCGQFADRCGNATPLAAGGMVTFASGAVPFGGDVWFGGDGSGECPAFLYRVPEAGGDAQRVLASSQVVAFEADDTALYVVERTDFLTAPVSAFAGGQLQAIGTLHAADMSGGFAPALTRTPGGVVAYDGLGPQSPAFFRVGAAGLVSIPAATPAPAYLGSAPAYDGTRLFVSLEDPPFISPDGALWDRKLVDASGSAPVTLGENAETRRVESVAIDADAVYFVTGDPSGDAPMGISRVPKGGGTATPLVAPEMAYLREIRVDESDVFFVRDPDEVGPVEIRAVPKAGGAVRKVWSGSQFPTSRLRIDGAYLYFSVEGRYPAVIPDGTGPGGFIVRVAKDTALP